MLARRRRRRRRAWEGEEEEEEGIWKGEGSALLRLLLLSKADSLLRGKEKKKAPSFLPSPSHSSICFGLLLVSPLPPPSPPLPCSLSPPPADATAAEDLDFFYCRDSPVFPTLF